MQNDFLTSMNSRRVDHIYITMKKFNNAEEALSFYF